MRNPGGPAPGLALYGQVRTGNPRGTTVMDGCRESDSPRVSAKPPNNGAGAPGRAEGVEKRGLAKGGTWSSIPGAGRSAGFSLSQVLDRVRQAVCLRVITRGRSPVR